MPPKTILIVEDNFDNRTVYATIFRHAGYEVFEGIDGVEGVNLALATRPDFILMDLSMPRMTGWEAIEILRANSETRDIPVCAVSAHVLTAGDWERAMEAGFTCYLTKPIEPKKVLAEVQKRIGLST